MHNKTRVRKDVRGDCILEYEGFAIDRRLTLKAPVFFLT